MEGQIEIVIVRCGVCRKRRPADTPTALLRLVRGPEGRWRADLLKHSPAPVRPWTLGESDLGNERFSLVGDDGRLWSLSLVPVRVEGDSRTITVACRWCDRPPRPVRYAREGERALARGLAEVDV